MSVNKKLQFLLHYFVVVASITAAQPFVGEPQQLDKKTKPMNRVLRMPWQCHPSRLYFLRAPDFRVR